MRIGHQVPVLLPRCYSRRRQTRRSTRRRQNASTRKPSARQRILLGREIAERQRHEHDQHRDDSARDVQSRGSRPACKYVVPNRLRLIVSCFVAINSYHSKAVPARNAMPSAIVTSHHRRNVALAAVPERMRRPGESSTLLASRQIVVTNHQRQREHLGRRGPDDVSPHERHVGDDQRAEERDFRKQKADHAPLGRAERSAPAQSPAESASRGRADRTADSIRKVDSWPCAIRTANRDRPDVSDPTAAGGCARSGISSKL